MSRSNIRRQSIAATPCARDAIAIRPSWKCSMSRGASVLVIELQGALFFGTAERLAQIVDGETAQGTTALLLELRRVTEIDSTGARILGDIDAALARARRQARAGPVRPHRDRRAAGRYFPWRPLLPRHRSRHRMGRGRSAAECRNRAVARIVARPPSAAERFHRRPDRAAARLAGAGGVAGRSCHLPARRSRLVALSRHQGPRQRASPAR